MLCVITQPTVEYDYKYGFAPYLKAQCRKARIKYKEVASLSEAYGLLQNGNGSVFLYAATEKWVNEIIKLNQSYGLSLTVSGAVQLQYGSRTCSVCQDIPLKVTRLVTYLNACGAKSVALFGFRPYVDIELVTAESISCYIPVADGINPDTTLSKNYKLLKSLPRFPSTVICPNDLTAIYLINHLHRDIGEDFKEISVVSMEQNPLSEYYPYGITAFKNANKEIAKKTVELSTHPYPNGTGAHFSFMSDFAINESTQSRPLSLSAREPILNPFKLQTLFTGNAIPVYDDDYNNLLKVNFLMQSLGKYEMNILSTVLAFDSYEEIARHMKTNTDSVKYFTSKLYKRADFGSRKNLKAVLSEYSLRLGEI